jgi:TPR repeat protein
MRALYTIGVAAVFAGLSMFAVAGPIENADAAIKNRDYAGAIRIVQPMAERGDANAQYILGMLYENGLGVTQDRVKAYMWLTLAASQGRENAATVRDLSARLMSPIQIEQAKALAAEWKPVNK